MGQPDLVPASTAPAPARMRDHDFMPASSATPVAAVLSPPHRILSIDILRGLTIAFMILVNDPGDSRQTYTQLEHARWNGWTLTDLIFPNFLFLVGASIILSLTTRSARGDTRLTLARRIVRRAVLIFLIDLLLAALPYFHLSELRFYGVLTRIALCYLIIGIFSLFFSRIRIFLLTAALLLVTYWVLMRFVPVPGFGVPTHGVPFLDPNGNLVAVIDRALNAFLRRTVHTGRLYEGTRDPEGLLSTLPALATTLFGAAAALWLRRNIPRQAQNSAQTSAQSSAQTRTLLGFLASGLTLLLAGLLWNPWFPINKNLWTSSYVLFAAGCSLLGLSLCFWLVDILRLQHRSHAARTLLWPWLVFGSNAITAYAIAYLFATLLYVIRIPDPNPPNRPVTLWAYLYRHLFSHGNSTPNTSLAWALVFVALCFVPNLLLWRKRIFLKV